MNLRIEILVGRKLPDHRVAGCDQVRRARASVSIGLQKIARRITHQIPARIDLFVLRSRHHLLELFADVSLFGECRPDEYRWCRDCREGTIKEAHCRERLRFF